MFEATTWLAQEWADRLGPAVSAMSGTPAQAHLEPEPAAREMAGALIWRQAVDVTPDAAIWVELSAEVWRAVGQRVLVSAGLEDAEESDVRSTFVEVLQQSLAQLSAPLGARLQREVSVSGGEVAETAPEHLEWRSVEVELDGARLGRAWLAADAHLAGLLDGAADDHPSQSQVDAGPAPSALPKGSRTLDLLMEVEMPVGVSFGRAQMRLKDAIKLTTGSIVELNRSIIEPVEIIVNNCVIARGEVVVVQGNYGVRIQQIVSREERLRTLF